MSLILNEAALNSLLESPDGEVGRLLDRVSNHIAGRYEAVIGVVWENQDPFLTPKVDYEIVHADNGIQATIGIVDEGSVSEYMADKMVVEQDRLLGAIMTTWEQDV